MLHFNLMEETIFRELMEHGMMAAVLIVKFYQLHFSLGIYTAGTHNIF